MDSTYGFYLNQIRSSLWFTYQAYQNMLQLEHYFTRLFWYLQDQGALNGNLEDFQLSTRNHALIPAFSQIPSLPFYPAEFLHQQQVNYVQEHTQTSSDTNEQEIAETMIEINHTPETTYFNESDNEQEEAKYN